MRILIDADGCPVVDETVSLAKEFSLECIILCDTAHYFNRRGHILSYYLRVPTV